MVTLFVILSLAERACIGTTLGNQADINVRRCVSMYAGFRWRSTQRLCPRVILPANT